jgi:hypothetical protein
MSYSDYVKKWEENIKKNAEKAMKNELKIEKSTGIKNINFPANTIKYKKKVNRINLHGKK